MGYKIPPPDFTIPPVNYNIAADIGKAFAAGITRYGDAIRACLLYTSDAADDMHV